MLKLDTPIAQGRDTFEYYIIVRSDIDIRNPSGRYIIAPVKVTETEVVIGQIIYTDQGIKRMYPEPLPEQVLTPDVDTDPLLLSTMLEINQQNLEVIEQTLVGLQADEKRNRLKSYVVGLTEYQLNFTYVPMGSRKIVFEVIDQRTPLEEDPSLEEIVRG